MINYTGPFPSTGLVQPTAFPQVPGTGQIPFAGVPMLPGQIQPTVSPFIEQSFIENILRLNKDKVVTVYMNFENAQWGSKIFRGAIEAAGKDHIIIRDTTTNMRYLLLSIYLNYITFDEPINYSPEFGMPSGVATTLRKKEASEENK